MTIRSRRLTEKGAIIICAIAAVIAAGMLFLIIGDIIIGALPSLSLHFLLTPESKTGLGEGIANAVVGTILLSLASTILATPFAISTAIYLKRYAPENRFTDCIRFMIEVMSGTPSIVVGMFGLLVLVIYLKPFTGGFSFIAGTVALALLIMPVIERAVESAIDTVDPELETGSYALGATKWQTLKMTTLPAAVNGIMTSLILGFGRAAEESSVVILTAGYSQFIPDFAIVHNDKFFLGFKIYPLNDLVGTLPYAVYNAYENSNVIPMSNAYAIALFLIAFVLLVNITAKVVCSRAIGCGQGSNGNFTQSVCSFITDPFRKKKQKDQPSYIDDEMVSLTSLITPDVTPEKEDVRNPEKTMVEPLPDRSMADEAENTVPVPPIAESLNKPQVRIQVLSEGTGVARLFLVLRQKIHSLVRDGQKKKTPTDVNRVQRLEDLSAAAAVRGEQPFPLENVIGSVRSFFLTLAPFVLVAVILMVLSIVLPVLSPIGSNGPAGSLTVPVMTLIICVIGIVCALFLVRNSTLFLLRRQKGRISNRSAEFASIAIGFCLVIIGAFIFSAHIFSPIPAVQSPDSGTTAESGLLSYFAPSGNGSLSEISGLFLNNSLFSFLYKPVNATSLNTMDASNRSARLAALLAAEDTPAEVTVQNTPVTPQPSFTLSSSAPVSFTGSAVPVKNALDIGESYWYGDSSRPCLATIYNATTMPLYFYWDQDWNRFVQVNPAFSGDTFLVIFIRIEDTGNMSAIVPGADQIIVTYNGQTYTNEPYFDQSVLDANEISIYTANYNLLPYQWIREIGQQKRDYAFLTGYNIFGQNSTANSTVTSTVTSSSVTGTSSSGYTPPNGEGWFIQPGRSNAIDGYLIYEVPGAVTTDLRDTYAIVQFNSFSSTQWRLGK